jgi:integrase
MGLQARIKQYLVERRQLGFKSRTMGYALARLSRYATKVGHCGPLTIDLMTDWARQAKGGHGSRATAARQLGLLRPFTRWLQQFEPSTDVPTDAVFGPVPGRMTPHVYREGEIVDLMSAAAKLGPVGGLRCKVVQTLFGLMACTGLRISEVLALRDADVDMKSGVLTIHLSKFGKSRLVPLHPSAVAALVHYRKQRDRHVQPSAETPFFVSTRGRLLGKPVGERQIHRIFEQLRRQLGWVDRGAHGHPRVHDLRHSFAVRRLVLWHEQGEDVDQKMLALSTYLGHARISNTYWYLTGVPELMSLAAKRFEFFADPWESEDE